ncbi:hypothetical protein ES703_101069 [subsurface metagenome]
MSCKAYYSSPEGNLQRDLTGEEIKVASKSRQDLIWVDIVETTEKYGKFLDAENVVTLIKRK